MSSSWPSRPRPSSRRPRPAPPSPSLRPPSRRPPPRQLEAALRRGAPTRSSRRRRRARAGTGPQRTAASAITASCRVASASPTCCPRWSPTSTTRVAMPRPPSATRGHARPTSSSFARRRLDPKPAHASSWCRKVRSMTIDRSKAAGARPRPTAQPLPPKFERHSLWPTDCPCSAGASAKSRSIHCATSAVLRAPTTSDRPGRALLAASLLDEGTDAPLGDRDRRADRAARRLRSARLRLGHLLPQRRHAHAGSRLRHRAPGRVPPRGRLRRGRRRAHSFPFPRRGGAPQRRARRSRQRALQLRALPDAGPTRTRRSAAPKCSAELTPDRASRGFVSQHALSPDLLRRRRRRLPHRSISCVGSSRPSGAADRAGVAGSRATRSSSASKARPSARSTSSIGRRLSRRCCDSATSACRGEIPIAPRSYF